MKKNKYLWERFAINKTAEFQRCQTETFERLLTKKSYQKVLEVGCGRGYFSYVGAKTGKFRIIYGSDVYDAYQKHEIEPYVNKIGFGKIRRNKLPFKNNTFDLIFSTDVIEHVDDEQTFVSE